MEENRIRSGRTKAAIEEMERWYDSIYTELEWDSEYFQKTLKSFLDTKKEVPFRCFLVRYLMVIYGEEFCPELFPATEEKTWLAQRCEYVLKKMDENMGKSYEDSPEVLQSLADKVFENFIENGVYSSKRVNGDRPGKVMGYINGQGLQWTKDLLLKKMEAGKCGADIQDKDADITEDELWAFAFGLNMAYEDVEFFIRKVFRRAFNFWDWKDFLLKMTFRYADGNIYQFYRKLKIFYEKEAKPREESVKPENNSADTKTIQDQMDGMFRKIKETRGAIALDENDELPMELKNCISSYKYRIQNAGNRQHTSMMIRQGLLKKFEEDVRQRSGDIKEKNQKEWTMTGFWYPRNAESEVSGEKAQGKVIVYYELNKGLNLPKGTVFIKPGKNGADDAKFLSTEDIKIPPVETGESRSEDVVIEVQCTEEEKKVLRAEDHRAYIPKKTEFTSENKSLSDLTNKSCFKPSDKKAKIGDKIRITGKLFGRCEADKTIYQGTRFLAENEKGEEITFESVKEVRTQVCTEIWVEAAKPGEENTATKNEITRCSAGGREKGILRIENKKIGFIQKKQEEYAKGNRLFDVLYGADAVDGVLDKSLSDAYVEKIGDIFRGAMLSSSKLYNIQKGTEKNITRKDIVTLSFLTYVNEYETEHSPLEKYYALNGYLNFVQRTNENLEKCGFYGLYELNPYDSLLMYLAGNAEAIASYRNIWSWYLIKRDEQR